MFVFSEYSKDSKLYKSKMYYSSIQDGGLVNLKTN